ncbi:MAG: phosphodiester glycosidase family protein [Oscillospiraceae bacterium]|nr:phosphodiester glycosidase family protein [Oscillospiraceae bacterium]
MREYDLEEILAEFNDAELMKKIEAEAAQPRKAPERRVRPGWELDEEDEAAETQVFQGGVTPSAAARSPSLGEGGYSSAAARSPYPEEGEEPHAAPDASTPEDDGEEAAPSSAPDGEVPADEPAPLREGAETETRKRKKKRKKKESVGARIGFGMLSFVFMLVSLAVLAWTLQNVHPDTSSSSDAVRTAGSSDLVSRLDRGLNNAKADALSDITYIPKHYSIPEGDTVAPRPQEACFGSVSPDSAQAVMDVVQKARDSGLLEGQEVIFRPDLNFRQDTDIQYYCDDTILTILWKEIIDGNTVSCCEVKVADASQFRRKLVDDTFGSPTKLFATSIAASVNAVVAMNADFYMFRDFGIVAYNRDLYRFGEETYTGSYKKYNCTDTLFIDENGDFRFWHRLEEASREDMLRYLDGNRILFSIAFGPILVEDGRLTPCDWYPAGEIDRGYSRAGIGQYDHLHYFYMSLNHSPEMEARWTVNRFGEQMYARGLRQAYCLDGGQTSEIVWRGSPFNYIDFGGEREVSDIIYFATAIPESEAAS